MVHISNTIKFLPKVAFSNCKIVCNNLSGSNMGSEGNVRRGSTSSLIVVSTNDKHNETPNIDQGNLTSVDFVQENNETSRLRYLLWPLVKLMTLLRFWRKPTKEIDSDSDVDDLDGEEGDDPYTSFNDSSSKNTGRNIQKPNE